MTGAKKYFVQGRQGRKQNLHFLSLPIMFRHRWPRPGNDLHDAIR